MNKFVAKTSIHKYEYDQAKAQVNSLLSNLGLGSDNNVHKVQDAKQGRSRGDYSNVRPDKDEKVGFQTGTIFGGILTICIIVILLIDFGRRAVMIYETHENEYKKESSILPEEKIMSREISLGNFNNSLNFFTGIAVT